MSAAGAQAGTHAEKRRGPAGSRQAPPAAVTRPLVLAIEDNPHDWEIYGRILCYNGYDVMHATDGEQGLDLARRHVPDLVLLDLTIPRLDGLDVCRLLKSEPYTSSIAVMVLSSRDRERWEPLARAAGCDAYLEKPISPMDVLHKVERAIGRAPLPGTGRPPLYSTPQE
jgi:two-component system, cell cycle response regulator DivK